MLPTAATCAPRENKEPYRPGRPQGAQFLDYYSNHGDSLQRISLRKFPFRLGRTAPSDFLVACVQISRTHAEIYEKEGTFRLRDLGSTNGTFVNGRRVRDAEVRHGDIVNLAHREFRFVSETESLEARCLSETDLVPSHIPLSVLHGMPLLRELLHDRLVRTAFQPILDLTNGAIVGYEALGRGTHRELDPGPAGLFRLADRCGVAVELSRLLRTVAVQEAQDLPGRPAIFLNAHPAELADPTLLPSLCQLREGAPADRQMVVEIHEDTVADPNSLRTFRDALHDAGLLLAFDDFGTGQARLTELAEASPDFIKLNMSLIREIHRSASRQKLLRTITRVAHDLGVTVLAEGVEAREEAEVCSELGCNLGQGFFYGPPTLARDPAEQDTCKIEFIPRANAAEVFSFA